MKQIEPAYFDLTGASAYLGGALSVRHLRRLIVRPGGLPYIRVGRGKIMLKRSDLDSFMQTHRREPIDLDALANEVISELRGQP